MSRRCGHRQLFGGAKKRPCSPRAASSPPHQHPPQLQPPTSHTNCSSRESPTVSAIIMVAPEVHHLFHHPIADHSFSADRQTLAVARENNVDLYAKQGSGFKLQDELTGHDKTVTGVDIAPRTGKIVTCSQGEL